MTKNMSFSPGYCDHVVLERPGPYRESDSAGCPPGPSARGASHWQTHPVWSIVGMPRPHTHHRCFTQLQRPFLHTPGRALSSQTWKHTLAVTHSQTIQYIAALPSEFSCLAHSNFSSGPLKGKEKMADMRRKTLSRNSKSDHLTIVNAFQVKKPTPVTLVLLSLLFFCMNWFYINLSCIDWPGLGGS